MRTSQPLPLLLAEDEALLFEVELELADALALAPALLLAEAAMATGADSTVPAASRPASRAGNPGVKPGGN